MVNFNITDCNTKYKKPIGHKQTGFTLIEVMVALMILAVVATAASQASSGYIYTVEGMKTRTLAHFVAQNIAAEIKINNKSITTSSQKITQQGRDWQITLTPKDTALQEIVAVNINVAEIIADTNDVGTGANITVFHRQKE